MGDTIYKAKALEHHPWRQSLICSFKRHDERHDDDERHDVRHDVRHDECHDDDDVMNAMMNL